MKDYYEILGLEQSASKEEIKKAYFRLVRKYPPDRYETEFMDIREAYETLSNEKTRKQYDSINLLSPIIKINYDLARNLMEEGEFSKAIKELEKILDIDPDLLVVKALLGEAYLKNNNNGKALKIYSELTASEPENAAFAGYLAKAYLGRGWQKKAISAYNRAIDLDPDNISLWMGLGDAHIKNKEYWEAKAVYERALDKVKEIGDNTSIYMKLIMVDISFEMYTSIYKYLDKLTEIAVNNEEVKDNVAWTLSHIAMYLMRIDKAEHAHNIINKAVEILPNNEDILEAKKEIESFSKYIKDFERLNNDSKVKDEVTALIAFKVLPTSMIGFGSAFDVDIDALTYMRESQIIESYEIYKSSIDRLKREYPELYAVKADFFNKVTNSVERRKLQSEYRKKMWNYVSILDRMLGVDDEDDEDDDDEDDDWYKAYEPQEPFVREEPKVGRNDPCPCGSGKKYKKCCGK